MQCEICKQAQAVVVIHLQLPERGLTIFACRKCSETVLKLGDLYPTQEPLKQVEHPDEPAASRRAKAPICPTCGCKLQLQDEVATWQLGCPDCYYALDDEARARLLAGQASRQHRGRSGAGRLSISQLPELLLDYQLALAGEEYERAAGLLERIKANKSKASGECR